MRVLRAETWEIGADLLGKASTLPWGGVEWPGPSSGVRLNSAGLILVKKFGLAEPQLSHV